MGKYKLDCARQVVTTDSKIRMTSFPNEFLQYVDVSSRDVEAVDIYAASTTSASASASIL